MSVYIPGMKMPSNCEKCLYSSWSNFYQIYVCNAIRHYEPVLFDKKHVKSTATVRSGRADNCPLIPVPEHGDLIDRDKLEKDIDNYIGGEESRSRFHHWVQVQDAVIPIDKGEEK